MASNPITNLYFFRRKSKAWTAQDLADLARLEAAIRRCGLNIESEHGCSDEGDPWFIFTCVDTEDPIIHIAYIDGFFVIASGFGEPLKDRALGAAVESFLTRHVARLPVAQTPDAASNVVAHPAALLPGLVAPLFVKNLSENLNNSYSTGVPLAPAGNHGWVATAASRLKDQGSFPAAAILLAALAAALHQRGSLGPSNETAFPAEHAMPADVPGHTMDVATSDITHGSAGTGAGTGDVDLHQGSAAQHDVPPRPASAGAPERLQLAEITSGAPHMVATASVGQPAGRVAEGGESPLAAAESVPELQAATDEISDAVKQAIDLMLAGGRSSNSAPDAEPEVQLASLDRAGGHQPELLVADDRSSDAPAAERILAARQSHMPQESYPAGDYPGIDGLSRLPSPVFPEDRTPPEPDHTAGSPTVAEPAPSSPLAPTSPPPVSSVPDTTPTDRIVPSERVISLVENFMDNNRIVHIRGEGGKDAFGQGGGDIVYATSDLHDPPSPEKTFVLTTLAAEDGTHITLIGYLSTDVWLV
ncbi:hypothetical protein [Chelatococcus asaccharovorans]|uniref:Uncharacterized protein n=1 Tax=Chelatococcus asaccharovorans TaxID=28210 RepID=A0A2V3U917_9HYPH|nr:hypothetical protein [Chelatococcus asaccharovorans]MBS7705633.1 hypothetical protein [Chelatococcus asaccharovorans]PXW59953.1 hypothetical protein C7450_1043 [Chelatococcus asaccharovorans]